MRKALSELIFGMAVILLFSYKTLAQTVSDYKYVKYIVSKEVVEKGNSNYVFNKPNNISGYVSVALFKVYKSWFSSQDANKCPFEPSCSVYMMHSLQKKGVFVGLLNGIDRFMRCNGHDLDKYPINKENGKLIDPVK